MIGRMSNPQLPENLSVEELEQLLYRKKHALRRQRLQRLKAEGRVVEVAGVPAPNAKPPRCRVRRQFPAVPCANISSSWKMSQNLPLNFQLTRRRRRWETAVPFSTACSF